MTWEGLTPPYRTIVADPPWKYDTPGVLADSGKRMGAGAGVRYSLMSTDELCAMPVAELADDDAHLYLWTTNRFMCEAHDIARWWGFTPKTILTWTKTHQDDPSRVSMKVGHYFRGATEHVVFAVRGSLPPTNTEGVPTGFLWPRLPHSVKPDQFFDVVERVSPGPRLELFARAPRLGWDHWGYGYESASSESAKSAGGGAS